jgi:basic membrane lipoprotein Med (substrate-binding protein (PBP1-ABC) superfamily)
VASAKVATLELVKRGAQMILGACGTAVEGVVQGVEQAVQKRATGETQFVGLVGDKSTVNKQNVMLTSVVVNPAVAVEQALRDVRADRFGKHVYTLDFANGGLTLQQTGRTPADAYEAADQLKETIGSVALPQAANEHDLDALIKGS